MAIQDLLRTLGQRASTGLERMGATTDPRLSPAAQRLAGIQNLSQALRRTGATLSGDPQRMALQAQEDERLRQRRLDEERKRELMAFAQQDPSLAKMYEVFGEQGLRQEVLRQRSTQDELISNQKQIERLRGAGFNDKEINLVLAGVTPKDVMEMRGGEVPVKTTEQLTQEVEKEKLEQPESIKKLQNIEEAFGGVDATQYQLAKYLGPLSPFGAIAPETVEAVNAKNTLNERIREKFVNEYTGRPSVYINQRIDTLLPMGEYIRENEALSKYQETKGVINRGLSEMKSKIDSGLYSGEDLLEVQNQYKDIQSLVKDLEVAIDSLEKVTEKPESLDPLETVGGFAVNTNVGAYDDYFLNQD